MKRLLVVLCAFSAVSAYAANVGSLEVNSDLDSAGDGLIIGSGFVAAPQYQIGDDGKVISGESGITVYLERQANGGLQGFVDGRPFNLVCTATACTDNGSTQLDIAITQVAGGYKLSGTLNFVNVSATVTASKISISTLGGNTDESVNLRANSDGSYSGQGVAQAADTFQISVDASGSLAGLKDPATFIALLISPLVGN